MNPFSKMKLSLTVALQKKKVATTFEAQENAFQVTSSILTLNSWPKQKIFNYLMIGHLGPLQFFELKENMRP